MDVSPTDKQKYIFLGDSYMFGWELNDNKTIPYYFMGYGNFTKDQIINYGHYAFGMDKALLCCCL